jgi:hypothetical protein
MQWKQMTAITGDYVSRACGYTALQDFIVIGIRGNRFQLARDRHESQESQQIIYGIGRLIRRETEL